MDWSKGYEASYYLSLLDKETMRDIDTLQITSGSISRYLTELRESATINCIRYPFNHEEKYIRVWLDTKQDGGTSHTPLFTGIATSPSDKYKGVIKKNTLEVYSVLKIAEDVLLPRGWYAPVDANGPKLIKNLLSIIKTKIIIKDSDSQPLLSQSIIAEQNENHMSMADKILSAINWTLKLDGYGNIYLEPLNRDRKVIFDSNENDILETDIDITYDWYAAPNILRATIDDTYAIARDDDPKSPLSTVSRGREVWFEDSEVNLNANETLAEYAQRMLKEYQQIATKVSYSRRYWPDIYPGDVIGLNYPAQTITGDFMISNQSITLGPNATTSEEVIKL